jgi:hypothetical protein
LSSRTIVTALELARIPHMVVGSFASTAHGEHRTTRDLDLVIDPRPDQLHELLGAFDSEHFYVDPDVARDALRRRSMFNFYRDSKFGLHLHAFDKDKGEAFRAEGGRR